jgi:hypothetical protein
MTIKVCHENPFISDFFMYKEGIYHKTNLARSGANCYINLYFSALY